MERILVGEGGWCRVELDDPTLTVMARFTVTETGRVAIAEVVLARDPGVTADTLRAIPIGKVEAWANGPGRDDVVAAIERERAEPDRGTALHADVVSATLGASASLTVTPAKPLRSRVRNLRLQVPEGQPKPDTFYREVARVFSDLAVDSASPAADLAVENGVPVTRVHGWIKEARRRGFLAPGERQARRQP